MRKIFTVIIMVLFIMPGIITVGGVTGTKSSCTVTALKNENEKHSFVWVRVKDPTYTEEGTDQEICSDCDCKGSTRVVPCLDPNQVYVTVQGYVYDEKGKPLSDSLVKLYSVQRLTRTDSSGFYKFNNVELGDHHLQLYSQERDNVLMSAVNLAIKEDAATSAIQFVADGHVVSVDYKDGNVEVDLNGRNKKENDKTFNVTNESVTPVLLLCLLLITVAVIRQTNHE